MAKTLRRTIPEIRAARENNTEKLRISAKATQLMLKRALAIMETPGTERKEPGRDGDG